LNEIKEEIMHPYREHRHRFQSATYASIFTMLTGETEETLKPGMVVSCEVTKLMDRFCRVRLANGLDGTIHSSKFPGNGGSDMLREDQFIQALVLKVDQEKMIVDLDAREEAVNKDWARNVCLGSRDRYFSDAREDDDKERKPCKFCDPILLGVVLM
jgi:transcription elongation factor SPT6